MARLGEVRWKGKWSAQVWLVGAGSGWPHRPGTALHLPRGAARATSHHIIYVTHLFNWSRHAGDAGATRGAGGAGGARDAGDAVDARDC